jgi:hypothetical protein
MSKDLIKQDKFQISPYANEELLLFIFFIIIILASVK